MLSHVKVFTSITTPCLLQVTFWSKLKLSFMPCLRGGGGGGRDFTQKNIRVWDLDWFRIFRGLWGKIIRKIGVGQTLEVTIFSLCLLNFLYFFKSYLSTSNKELLCFPLCLFPSMSTFEGDSQKCSLYWYKYWYWYFTLMVKVKIVISW